MFAAKLRESVRIHLRSDVPVGCALSGGVDSSSIAMLVNEINAGQASSLYTFTSTFPGDSSDAGVPPLGTGGTGRCPTPGQSDMSTTGEERRTGAGALPSIRV